MEWVDICCINDLACRVMQQLLIGNIYHSSYESFEAVQSSHARLCIVSNFISVAGGAMNMMCTIIQIAHACSWLRSKIALVASCWHTLHILDAFEGIHIDSCGFWKHG
jgi:hypothetical protein